MSRRQEELESMREDGLSAQLRREFGAAARATERFQRKNPTDLEAILDWIDQLRQAFGEPALDRRPWRGNDFRL